MQQYPVYLLWNRRKTLTGSPDPTRANGANRPCNRRPTARLPTGVGTVGGGAKVNKFEQVWRHQGVSQMSTRWRSLCDLSHREPSHPL